MPIRYAKGRAMRNLKHHVINLWKDESGQGATEYILLLVVVVALVLLFKGRLSPPSDKS